MAAWYWPLPKTVNAMPDACAEGLSRGYACDAARAQAKLPRGKKRAARTLEEGSISRQKTNEGAPRLAASSYLNTVPLIWSFTRGKRAREVELVTDAAPARCAELLARGQADAALVPVIEYQRFEPEVLVIPEVCVGASARVRSVVLVTRQRDLREIRSVALDTSSRTSAALIEIIFREFIGHAPQFASAAPDIRAMLAAHDAALLIGDPAMTFGREGLQVYDLASLWREYTGLGFVFAMWMARADARAAERALTVDFAGARDEGLAHIEEIAAAYEETLGLPRAELSAYLRENIRYRLDEEMLAGLEMFYRLARKHEIVKRERPLRLAAAQPAR